MIGALLLTAGGAAAAWWGARSTAGDDRPLALLGGLVAALGVLAAGAGAVAFLVRGFLG